jgi:hypothetical protein
LSTITQLLHGGAIAASVSGALYTATVTTTALTAVTSRDADRRRAALDVLKILLRARGRIS